MPTILRLGTFVFQRRRRRGTLAGIAAATSIGIVLSPLGFGLVTVFDDALPLQFLPNVHYVNGIVEKRQRVRVPCDDGLSWSFSLQVVCLRSEEQLIVHGTAVVAFPLDPEGQPALADEGFALPQVIP